MPTKDPEKKKAQRRRAREKQKQRRKEDPEYHARYLAEKARGYQREVMKKPPKTHCRRGHEFTPENLYVSLKGKRRCKACIKTKYVPHPKVAKTPEERQAASRASHLKKNGWTLEMFSTTMAEQGERCAICRLPMKRPCTDHVHIVPPQPRGVLCDGCNTAIGLLGEDPERCRAAAEYLEAWDQVTSPCPCGE